PRVRSTVRGRGSATSPFGMAEKSGRRGRYPCPGPVALPSCVPFPGVMRVKLLADVTPLRESPAFRRMWAGGVLSAVGGTLSNFAVTLQVYELTRSPAAVGLLGLAVLVPTLAVGLFGGAAADALDRRKVVLAATAAQALVSGALAAQAYAGL